MPKYWSFRLDNRHIWVTCEPILESFGTTHCLACYFLASESNARFGANAFVWRSPYDIQIGIPIKITKNGWKRDSNNKIY